MEILVDPLTGPEIAAFLAEHTAELRSITPPESTHTLDLDDLRTGGATVWSVYDDGRLVGCGALKPLDAHHAELKSMRTARSHTRRGIASALVAHILDHARAQGFTRVSLETGSEEFFAPARALYARHGFVECDPFGSYRPDPLSTFMTRTLD